MILASSCTAACPHPGAGTREVGCCDLWVLALVCPGLTHLQPPAQFPGEGPTGQWGQGRKGSPDYL